MTRRHTWAYRAMRRLESDPDAQIRFHLVMMRAWEALAVAGPVLMALAPKFWVMIGVLFVYELSIYANWDTDFDAVSAASAYKQAKQLNETKETA